MSSTIPDHWANPRIPRRPGFLERWVAWCDERRRPAGRRWDGSNIITAWVLAWLTRLAFPSPEAEGAYALVLWVWLVWFAVQVARIIWTWLLVVGDAAAMLWEWHGTDGSSGGSSTGPATRVRALGSAARGALRAARRGRSG